MAANTWNAQIATLAPDHYWALDEASGVYLDSGSVATLDLSESIAGAPWRQAPSIAIRGAPRQYALWGSMANGGSARRTASGIQVAGHTTGTFMGVIFCYSLAELGFSILQTLLNNSGVFIGLRINLDGSVDFIAQRTGANFSRATTAAGVITSMTPHLLVGVQRADATGFHIFVDGVDVTSSATQGGTVGVDDYVDQIFSGDAPSDLTLGDVPPGTSSTGGYCYGTPGIWVNTALSDSQVLDLFNSMGSLSQSADDWFDYVVQTMNGDCRWWMPGWYDPVSSLRTSGMIQDGAEVDQMIGSGFTTPPSAENVADSGGVDEQRITAYNGRHQLCGSNNPSISDGAATAQIDSINDFTGTINCLVKITSAPVGIQKNFFAFGNGVGNDNIIASIVGSIFGWSVKLRMEATSGDFWQGVGNGFTFPDADVHMFTFVQDGTGVRFYIDGSNESFFVTSSGATIDDETWLSDMDILGSPGMAQSGEPASPSVNGFTPNQLHDMFVTRTILSAGQVSALWDAVSGFFAPAQPSPSFVTELETTGNGGTGPDWWWRMNAIGSPILDVGSAQDMAGPNADSIATQGNPLFDVTGPFSPVDTDNRSVFFDGLGDSFEIGVAGVSGQLLNPSTGTMGFIFSRNALEDENIVFAIGNDAYTQFLQIGLNDDRLELIVQTSAGNRATYTSSVTFSGAFVLVFITCDGTNYRFYLDGPEDTLATLVTIGTGAEGDWFDLITADQTAVAARADSAFTTETTGRISELFLYDGEVLSAATIASLTETAIADGLLGAPSATGVVTFENVTFKNGALSDIRAETGGVSAQQQFVRANQCKFLGGMQGDAVGAAQTARLRGPVVAQFRGCKVDLQATPGTFGRGGIVGSQIDTALSNVNDGNILVSDCDFDSIGFIDGSDFLAAVMCEAGFGMTVEGSRFVNSLGAAVGWRADAQRVKVVNNQIEGTTQTLGGIHSAAGFNARLGSGWMIRGNKVLDSDGNAININGVTSAGGTNFARNILILENETDGNLAGVGIRANQIGDAIIEGNKSNRCTEGIRLGEMTSAVKVRRNEVTENSLTGIICSEGSLQLVDLTIDRNVIDGGAALGDGITLVNTRSFHLTNNKLASLDLGIQIGTIGVEGFIDGNDVLPSVSTPFALLAPPITGLTIGTQLIEDLGNANVIDVSSVTIEVQAHHHGITNAGAAQDIETIDGPLIDGWLLVLRRAPFSNDMTIRDGVDNLNIGSDFLMDADNDQLWLVRDGANWNQLSRFTA